MRGKPWTLSQMGETIDRGPHMSALQSLEIKILAEEVAAKDKKGQCKVVLWGNIKEKPPEELKVSPISMITHKPQLF